MPSGYILGAYWPARRESITQCCDRLADFMSELAQCDPALEIWHELVESPKQRPGRRVDIKDRPILMKLLEEGRNRRDIGGEVIEELGFHFGLWNGADDDKAAGLSITCGLYWKSPTPNVSLSNCVVLDLPRNLGELSRAENMSKVLSVTAGAWQPAWAGVMSWDAMNARNFSGKHTFVDWMTYVPVSIGEVPAPSSVQQLPGGGSIVAVQPTPPSGGDPRE